MHGPTGIFWANLKPFSPQLKQGLLMKTVNGESLEGLATYENALQRVVDSGRPCTIQVPPAALHGS